MMTVEERRDRATIFVQRIKRVTHEFVMTELQRGTPRDDVYAMAAEILVLLQRMHGLARSTPDARL